MTIAIRSFRDEYAFLSNMYLCEVDVEGWLFPSSENAYQAAKSTSPRDWWMIQKLSPGRSKRAGRAMHLRADWDQIKIRIMTEIVTLKFQQHPLLMEKLLATGSRQIIEENTWNDTFWGVCNGKGNNHLGKILMDIRSLNKS